MNISGAKQVRQPKRLERLNSQLIINMKKNKLQRQRRIRAKITGTADRPRMSVFRSNKGIAVQFIDDLKHVTLLGMRDAKAKGTKTDKAKNLGLEVAKLALEKKIKTVIFDKGSYSYHGRVKALAEGAREGGLKF